MINKSKLFLFSAITTSIITLIGAISAAKSLKLATIIIIVAGAFASGASLVSAIHSYKAKVKKDD